MITLPLLALLFFGLRHDARTIPSPLVGKMAPSFTLEELGGTRIALEELIGTPIVLNFWSTWCPSCLAEHMLIKEATEHLEHHVKFYSVLYEDLPENAKAFIKSYGEAAPILLDPDLKTAIDYGIAGVPETFFIDRQGKVVTKHVGPLDGASLAQQVEKILRLEEDDRVARLGNALRCPVCRGVAIADSPAEMARRMMEEVRTQVAEGKSDEEILSFFEARYGEWSLLQPKATGENLIIWLLPLFFLACGGVYIFLRRKP